MLRLLLLLLPPTLPLPAPALPAVGSPIVDVCNRRAVRLPCSPPSYLTFVQSTLNPEP